MKPIITILTSLAVAFFLLFVLFAFTLAQESAYEDQLITTLTTQNLSDQNTTVTYLFHNEYNGAPIAVTRTLPARAGDSLFVGGLSGNEALPGGFRGAAVVDADQPIVVTTVLIPMRNDLTKNRPIVNAFSEGSERMLLATVLKNKFGSTSKFAVQNADTEPINIFIRLQNADNAAEIIELERYNIATGSVVNFDMGTLIELKNHESFNGSALITAMTSSQPANAAKIVASVLELGSNGSARYDARAFEGVADGSNVIYMATALCNFGTVSAKQNTAYAIQNVSGTTANVTIEFRAKDQPQQPIIHNVTVGRNQKKSVKTCEAPGIGAGFTGSAQITTNEPVVVIGKAFTDRGSSAFLGESAGTAKLAFPYVRFASEGHYKNSGRQRVYLAIQNVGQAEVPTNTIHVSYYNKNGILVGTHIITETLESLAKVNSDAGRAQLQVGVPTNSLQEFGSPDANPGGGYGGAVIVEGPPGSQLIGVARVVTYLEENGVGYEIGEDYNSIPVE